ncbi:peroxisome biogenesis factor 10 [Salarias fasciatus]|uniref:RING-type E3 ubiquitin transferase n=1 Tax=Salarias fasciatus TaxID=181472 RepID=A0A672JLX2_SALFA|nr:peroxisome biogenesis factor 10 [Salarias fasciatus]
MSLAPANQAQLIRSSQKDEQYRASLRNSANEAFQTLAGSRRWLSWRREIELLSDLTYYSLTTLSGSQTLGEEYVNVVQVDPSGRRVPAAGRRGLAVLCGVFLPYLLDKLLVSLDNELQGGRGAGGPRSLDGRLRGAVRRLVGLLSEAQRRACAPAALLLQQTLALLQRLHTAVFYLRGSFYHVSKRTAGISYLCVVRPGGDDASVRACYRLLGVVSLVQLLVTVCLQASVFRQRQRARTEWTQQQSFSGPRSPGSGSRSARCILCLEDRRHATSTPCGHLFCWDCITEWCNTKAECPLCREKFQPQRLIYLRNYS